ncbi:MAG: neutral/alkaline non-lysosomal ceramidase N-terminal domain-containing protein [Verrucomicrobiae bacterium]|nr:neutral/alkaline non-lysosomal ceramidase N-terminal domain-containing protein [Verrucomicrobiae bacterium]
MGAVAGEFRAGVARVNITPPMPFYLSGYAARTNPATSVRTDLWAKALALQDRNGTRLVLVTADLIALPRDVTDVVAGRLMRRHGLRRSQLLFNASHTHSGPVVWSNLRVMFNLDAAEKARALDYAAQLTDKLTSVADAALANLSSAVLACGRGRAGFAVNRRQPTPSGFVIGHNPNGPVDHDVPVLKVAAPDGQLRAVLFGYACHNTTCPMSLEVDGDYAGAAQRALEAAHPGATALFMTLCAGDQNPHPRGSMEWVEKHGRELADAVERVLAGPTNPVRGPMRTAFTLTPLEFAPHTREQFEAEAKDPHPFKRRRAEFVLQAYDRGQPPRAIECPVQAVRFGKELTILALGGEVVVDYALRAKREFANENLVVAGYCNDVMCYVPSRRVLREGGYEAVDSMIYYGRPGPFAENVEETLLAAAHKVLKQVGVRPSSSARTAALSAR